MEGGSSSMPCTAIAPIDCRDATSSLWGCCLSSRVCQQFSGLHGQHTLWLQRFLTVSSWEATKTAKLNPVNEMLSYVKVLCLWMILVPFIITVGKVRDLNINRSTTDQCGYIPFMFGMVSQPDNHRDSTRRLDYKGLCCIFSRRLYWRHLFGAMKCKTLLC